MSPELGKTSRPSRSWWIALVLAVVGVGTAFGFSYFSELNRSRSVVDENLRFWAPELADIFVHQDWLRLSKLSRTFASPPVSSLVFRDQHRVVLSYPQETEEAECSLAEHHIIRQYGVTIGTLDLCHDPGAVIARAAQSPLFIATALSLFFLIGFAGIFPVLSYRKGLAMLVDQLAQWSNLASEVDSKDGEHDQTLWKLPLEERLRALVQHLVEERLKSERRALRDEVVRDVAHNIGSPLATLAIRVHQLEGIDPVARQSIGEGLKQITSILGKLKSAPALPAQSTAAARPAPSKIEKLSWLLDAIVNDKRLEMQGRREVELIFELTSDSYAAFAEINAADFRIVLSNLLNNAYESIADAGKVVVRLTTLIDRVQIEIQDTGCGLHRDAMDRLFEEGFSYGKTNGSGRGLFHARKALATWNGAISVESQPGAGTHVVVELPKAEAPAWFVTEIKFTDVDHVAILDDDSLIYSIWKSRVSRHVLESFSTPSEFKTFLKGGGQHEGQTARRLCLIDHRLGDGVPTGLDTIESEGLAEVSILVTSDAIDEGIRKRCAFLGARLLWKQEIHCVPVRA